MNERRLVAVGHSKAALPISPTPARLGRVGSAPMQVIQPSESDMQARVVYAIARQDGKPQAFAGIWETLRWPDETVHRSVGIMTTRPNAEMDELHDRMPVILEEQDWPVWLAELDGDHMARSCGRRRMARYKHGQLTDVLIRHGIMERPPRGARITAPGR